MAKQLPAHLSHKSALVLLPPSSISAPIETVRHVHDKHFARWPPHINLLYPFLASPSEVPGGSDETGRRLKQDIRMRIEKATKTIAQFRILLGTGAPGSFSHGAKSKTVWLGPATRAVQALQATLQAEFAECNADQRPYTPHLSVGQARSDHGALLLGTEITNCISAHVAE